MECAFFSSYVFNQLAKPAVTPHQAFRASNNIIAVGEKSSDVGGRVGNDIKDVPYSFGSRERRPLQSETERRSVCWDRDEDLADLLSLGTVHSETDVGAVAIAQLLNEQTGLGIILRRLSCRILLLAWCVCAYNGAAVDTNDRVEPWLQG